MSLKGQPNLKSPAGRIGPPNNWVSTKGLTETTRLPNPKGLLKLLQIKKQTTH